MSIQTFLLVLTMSFSGYGAAQSTYIRQPQISPDGSQIAFSYYGDIWTYTLRNEQLRRLTIHEAYESDPVWNMSGDHLAFASNRKGNTNVFTTSINGGVPKQLTYYPTNNIPTSWGKSGTVIFTTKRIYAGPEWDAQIYEVNGKGGTPKRLLTAYGSMASVSPNGKFVAYVKGACRIAREDYKGSAQRDVWLFNTETQRYTKITTSSKNDHSPAWDAANNLYYIGAESGRYNIYKQTLSNSGALNGASVKLTDQKIDGVQTFSVSANGTIVYTVGVDTYLLKNGMSTPLNLSIPSDTRFDVEKLKTTSKEMSGFSLAPNGKTVAFEVNGEIFVKLKDKDKTYANNISKHFFRDKSPQFISDNTVIFLSDRDGKFEIFGAVSDDDNVGLERSLKVKVKKLVSEKDDIENISVSPNYKKIAYQEGRGKLIIADIQEGQIKNKQVFSDTWAAAEGISWSPDSQWIAYSQEDLNFDSEIFIQSVSDHTNKMNVSMHPRSDSSPKWSADGKKLAFLSNRSGINYDVWMVWLQKEDWEKTKVDHQEGDYYRKQEIKEDDAKEKKTDKKKKKVVVKIDEQQIYERLIQVTSLQDNEYSLNFSPDSEFIYYSATNPATEKRTLYKVKWDGSKPKEIKGALGAASFEMSNGNLYFNSKGTLKELNGKSDKVTSYPHSVRVLSNSHEEQKQIFNEAIRALTAGFYDPNFHGYDWNELVKKYEPWVLSASTLQDYTYMFNLLLGQLNASHMGYRPSKKEEQIQSDEIGLLGLDVEDTTDGVRVNYILKNSVSDTSKSTINKGDIITAINGIKIPKNSNFYSLFKNTNGKETLVSLKSGEDVVLRPQKSLRKLQYEAWIQSRKDLVNTLSNNQLGYIHIQGMNMSSFERFERELKASGYGKKGIVIDVRYNGGGWTTDRLMAVLNVEQHAYTVPRGATKSLKNNKQFTGNYPFNERAILSVNTKPVVALCNENSYSNAEIFAHAFKNLGLGKLVGQPTFGAVISTGGRRLANGYIRMPFRAWYVKKSGKNMENEAPAIPHYLVENAPGWKVRGEDAQLQKAVNVLLTELK